MKYKIKPKRIPVSDYSVRKFNNRDEEGLKDIFYAMYPEMVHYSSWITNDFHESEDLVVYSFQKLWRYHKRYSNASHLIGVLYTIVKNESLNYLKSVSKRIRKDNHLLTEEVEESLADDVYDGDKHEIYKLLDKFASRLTGQCNDVIQLYLTGMPVRDIAIRLRISENTIYVQIHRAVKKLKKHFGINDDK